MRNVLKCKLIVPFLILTFLIVSCASMQGRERTVIGGLGGAAAGGLLAGAAGGSAAWIAAGSLLGALLGGAIGDRLDAADRKQAHYTAATSLETVPSGTTSAWQNPDSGNSGTFTPVRTYQTSSGEYCREFQQTIVVGGEKHQGYGTACRQSDGSWKIIN
jgi:surface antigen